MIAIGGRTIGRGQPTYLVAELSANHHGDLDRAIALVRAAKRAGADAVKLQTYTADTMTLDLDLPLFRLGEYLLVRVVRYPLFPLGEYPLVRVVQYPLFLLGECLLVRASRPHPQCLAALPCRRSGDSLRRHHVGSRRCHSCRHG